MSTRPTRPQRWPRNAETQRQRTIDDTTNAHALLNEARHELRRNPLLAELMIADVMTILERIHRLMAEARIGPEAPEERREENQ